jgi:THUMP domain-like
MHPGGEGGQPRLSKLSASPMEPQAPAPGPARARRGAVEVRKRGSAVDVADPASRLRLRGDARAVVVLTRVADRPWALVCAEARYPDPTATEEKTT